MRLRDDALGEVGEVRAVCLATSTQRMSVPSLEKYALVPARISAQQSPRRYHPGDQGYDMLSGP